MFKQCLSLNMNMVNVLIFSNYSWTARKDTEYPFGHPRLNLLCAETYWKGMLFKNTKRLYLPGCSVN